MRSQGSGADTGDLERTRVGAHVEFRVLGPLGVTRAGIEVILSAAYKQRLTLAALLSQADRPASTDWLIAAVWGDRPPTSARRNLQLYVHRLRGQLGAELISSGSDGYALLAGEALDATRFRRLAAEGRASLQGGDALQASRTLRTVLDLWKGPAYVEFIDSEQVAQEAEALGRLRLDTYEVWAEAELALGRHRDLIPDLADLAEAHPYRESLREYLMLAQYRSGRRSDALETFRQTRAWLSEELGVEPGPGLQRLHQAVLGSDEPAEMYPGTSVSLEIRTAQVATPRAAARIPHQLPVRMAGFVGRHDALQALDQLLPDHGHGPTDSVAIALIVGTAGVGKTCLAVHWAHRAADRFPDGQLYVNLRGFDPAEEVVDPTEAVRGFLDAFAVPSDQIPSGLQAQTALYRSVLAGKRMLIVLDNARDAEQVRPLLPGTAGCAVLVTSRNRMPALLASHGAHPFSLDLLTAVEARQLLAVRVGSDRIRAHPRVVDEIIDRCAQLPMALAIVAARAATRPGYPLSVLAAELRETQGGLDVFGGEDLPTDLRSVFSWSYRQLGAGAARVFRLLGLHPGTEVTTAAVASIAGMPVGDIRALLDELVQAHLVLERSPGRYTFHDLLRAYATELTHSTDTEDDQVAAVHRMLDHYLHTAHAGCLLLYPHRYAITLPVPVSGAMRADLADHAQALAWFGTEHLVLIAAVRKAVESGHDAQAWQLSWSLHTYLDRSGRWMQDTDVQRMGLEAAERLHDSVGQAHSHHCLANAETWLRHYDNAHFHYEQAIELFAATGDALGRAHSYLNRALVFEREERLDEALRHAQRSLDLFQATDYRSGQAKALNAVGWCQAVLGSPRQAMVSCQQAIDLLKELGDRYGEALTWDSLGYAYHLLGDLREATTAYQRSADLWRVLGDRHTEATVLERLGDSQHANNDPDQAVTAWRRALSILDELDDPGAGHVRQKLSGLHGSAAGSLGEGDRPSRGAI